MVIKYICVHTSHSWKVWCMFLTSTITPSDQWKASFGIGPHNPKSILVIVGKFGVSSLHRPIICSVSLLKGQGHRGF